MTLALGVGSTVVYSNAFSLYLFRMENWKKQSKMFLLKLLLLITELLRLVACLFQDVHQLADSGALKLQLVRLT